MRHEWRISIGFDDLRLVPWYAVSPKERASAEGRFAVDLHRVDRFTLIDICAELGRMDGDFSRVSTHDLEQAVGHALNSGDLVALRVRRKRFAGGLASIPLEVLSGGVGGPPAAPPAAPPAGAPAPAPPPAPAHTPGHLAITSRTAATHPADRARTTIGVGEKVRIEVTGATGTISWTHTGSSTLNTNTGTVVNLTAHNRAETAVLTATDSCGCTIALTLTVIEPSAVMMERTPGSNVYHIHGAPSVGLHLLIYILPATVSFQNIEISEGDCTGQVTGFFAGTWLDGVHHAGHGAGTWVGVKQPVGSKGSQVNGQDTAQLVPNLPAPYAAGTFKWSIPWSFRVNGGAAKRFATVQQCFNINAAGDLTVIKGDHATAALNDPSSGY